MSSLIDLIPQLVATGLVGSPAAAEPKVASPIDLRRAARRWRGAPQEGVRGDDIDITPSRTKLMEVESRLTDMGIDLTVTDVVRAGPDWEPIGADSP